MHEQLDGFTLGSAGQRAELNMNGYKITNMADGTEAQDAVTYAQTRGIVDDATEQAQLAEQHKNAAFGYSTDSSASADRSEEEADRAADEAIEASKQADRAEAAANVAGAQVGEIKWYFTDHTTPIDRPGMLLPLGQLLPKIGQYQNLWEAVAAGQHPVVTESEWQAGQSACYVDYDEDSFRVPLINGQFIRTPGVVDPEFNTRLAGATQDDSVGPVTAVSALAEAISASFTGTAVPAHTHTTPAHTHTMAHTHTRGTMEITGSYVADQRSRQSPAGAFTAENGSSPGRGGSDSAGGKVTFTASRAWSGATSAPSASSTGSGGASTSGSGGSGDTGAQGTGNTGSTGTSNATMNVKGATIAINVWQRTA